jgi:hypothetical protein
LEDVPNGVEKLYQMLNCFVGVNDEILFKCMDDALIDGDEFQKFIYERTVYRNKEWLWPWEWEDPCRTERPFYDWYKFRDNNEALSKFRKSPLFEAVVLDKNNGFDDISYVLTFYEYTDIGAETLFVFEKKPYDFITNVVPRLNKIIEVELKKTKREYIINSKSAQNGELTKYKAKGFYLRRFRL